MKRVLRIMGGLNRGGLETFAMNMYRSIDRTQIQFDFLLTQTQGGDYAEEAKSLGANIYTLQARNMGLLAFEKEVDNFFKFHSSDYCACHYHTSSLSSLTPLKYAFKYGIPVRVIHSHSSTISHSLRFRSLHILLHYLHKPFVKKWATIYLGCSDKAIDWLYDYSGIKHKALMCNNGINVEDYTYNEGYRKEIREEFNIKDGEIVLGHVGRFEQVKNQAFLVRILENMRQNKIPAKLILVGSGKLLEKIRIMVEEEGLNDFVIFTGVRSDVNRLRQAMDVFVMPSLFEGLPVTLIEAQAAGLPIVASDTISHDSDITGTILFEPINEPADDWAKCILMWKEKWGRPNNIEKIKQAGFDSKTTVKQLIEIYQGNV